jgi:glycosyltransferase involved in cell wall biosynthesis
VTTKDGNFFRGLYPSQEYAVLNHGITFENFCLPDVESEPHTLVFVGNYQHRPNVDAMEYFFREIWNDILSEVPDTRLYIIGPKPPKEIERFADDGQIIITGGVADIRSYIQKASVCIAPLITGAGMRGKVIDYAALRRTFVATSIATTDLVFRDGVDYFCADTAQEFILKVVSLLKDENRAKLMGETAFETARQNYDNRRLANFLLRFYEHLEAA